MDNFRLNKALSNPRFEGYKLHTIPQDNAVLQFPLVNRPTQAAVSGKVPPAFQEVQSRISHNHLATHNDSGRAIYVDADYNVILVELGEDRLSPSLCKIYEIPRPIRSEDLGTGIHREYPSVLFITSTSLLVSDGQGTMYLLRLQTSLQEVNTSLVGTYVLPSTGTESIDSPYRIHHVHQRSSSCITATLSSRFYSSQPHELLPGRHSAPIEFDVWGVEISLPNVHEANHPVPVQILWHRRGEDVPIYATFDERLGFHLLLGASEYRKLDAPPEPTYEPTPDEIVPIPRPDESFTSNIVQKPFPYSWTQMSDSVTIAIPLPSTTPKDKIEVVFSPTALTFQVDLDPDFPIPPGILFPRYSEKNLWDGISSTSSFWTFDRQAERTYGVLTLHLEKQNKGTRWSHVFASTGRDSAAEEDTEVPETLDPSELWNIREALEKYTIASQGEDTSGLGLGRGVPSLAQNELDEEVDSSVGRKAFITWIRDPSRQGQSEIAAHHHRPTPFQLLSTPLPGHLSDALSVIVKTNIDGNLFTLEPTISNGSNFPEWTHTSTYPALAFVLASKRDTRFIYHIPGHAVFAFESGSKNRGGNVYIYYLTEPKAITAKQSILRINAGDGSALMGVGSVTDGHGRTIIVCLTEGEFTLIRGV